MTTPRIKFNNNSTQRVAQILTGKRSVEIGEAVLGVAAIGLLDYFIPTELGLQQLDLYLLWVVVLGISARYGAPSGYVVSVLAAAVFDLLVYLKGNPYQASSPHQAIQPFLLFTAGVLVSELVRTGRNNAERATEKMRNANKGLYLLQEQYAISQDVKSELERRIANQPLSITTMSEFAGRMSMLPRAELYPVIMELLRTLLEVESCSIYRMEANQLRLAVGYPDGTANRPMMLTLDNVMIQRAIYERKTMTIRDMLQQFGPVDFAQAKGIMAGPLFDREGKLLGIIIIERMPFFKFTQANIYLFQSLLKWISGSLQNAQMIERNPASVQQHGS